MLLAIFPFPITVFSVLATPIHPPPFYVNKEFNSGHLLMIPGCFVEFSILGWFLQALIFLFPPRCPQNRKLHLSIIFLHILMYPVFLEVVPFVSDL